MTKGKKRTPEEITEVLTAYAITNNMCETSRMTGIPARTIKDIVDKNKDTEEFKKLQEEKKELFSKKANRVIGKAMELLERRFDLALDNEDIIEDLIDEIMCADEKEEGIKYPEKVAIAKKIGKLSINSLSEITTSMGTLYDKMRLAEDKSTENNKLDVNIKIIE